MDRASGGQVLTDREGEILLLLARRFTNREIADHLGIDLQTVKTHNQHIYSKLRVHGRVEAREKIREHLHPKE